MDAIVLGAGFATRLYPLTLNKAKPLLDIGGRPCIYNILDGLFALKEHGLRRVVVVSNERFAEDFRKELSGPFPVEVLVVSNGGRTIDEKLGAIGDMEFGCRYVDPDQPFWVLAGDNMHDFRLTLVQDAFDQRGGVPLVVTYRASSLDEVKAYSNLKMGTDGRIVMFQEKPPVPWSTEFVTCIYVFPGETVLRLREYLAEGNDPDKAGFFIDWLKDRQPVYCFQPTGRWFDIGGLDDLRRADAYFRK
jgi:glucose-1-phosphate thymidylyltransferase